MRIRKRKVPLPLSLLSPVPLSDPDMFSRSPVIMQQHDHHVCIDANLTINFQPSDHTSSNTSASDLKPCLGFEESERKDEIIDARRDLLVLSNTMGAKSQDDYTNLSISCEVKKSSRGSTLATTLEVEVEEKQKDKNAHQGGKKEGHGGDDGGGSKVRRGNTIMEGSRCSRVNGRGWRCCQPTLVGYSLCEHHLIKGRLRNMTSVRCRPLSKKEAAVAESRPRLSHLGTKGIDECGKRVKARLLSSLLDKTPSDGSNGYDC